MAIAGALGRAGSVDGGPEGHSICVAGRGAKAGYAQAMHERKLALEDVPALTQTLRLQNLRSKAVS